MRVPTLNQYHRLWHLTPTSVCVTATERYWDALERWGWVERSGTAAWITPDGVRAVAAGMEKHGRPNWPDDFKPATQKGERA